MKEANHVVLIKGAHSTEGSPSYTGHELRAIAVALAVLGLFSACSGQADRPTAKVDPRLVGTWELAIPGQGTWVMKFDAKGTYECTNESPLNLPGHSGRFEAVGGQWKTESTAGVPWTDGGPYQFVDDHTVLMTGKLGVGTWVRRASAPTQDRGKGGGGQKAPARDALKLSKIAPLVGKAREQATKWQKDAVLVGIFVKAGSDGRVDLANLMSFTNQSGGSITLQLYSAAARLVQMYGVDQSGGVSPQGPPMPPGTEIVPIPEPFLDLDEAIAKARESGLMLPKADGKSFLDARITGVQGMYGKPNSAIWKISAVDMGGAYPVVGKEVELSATTGTQTTHEKESGQLERSLLADELSKGKLLPYDPRRDFSTYRKEGDSLAAKWNAGLKLDKDSALKLGEVEVRATERGGKLDIHHVGLRYFRPVQEGWAIFEVVAFGTTDEKDYTKQLMLVKGEELNKVIPKANLHAEPVPEKSLAPDAALAKLAKLDPRWPGEDRDVRLSYCGNPPLGLEYQTQGACQDLPDDTTKRARNKWLWVTFGERTQRQRSGGFAYDQPNSITLAIDAVTGEPLITEDDLKSKPPEVVVPPGVDPALVGAWKTTLTAGGETGTMTLRISPNADCVIVLEKDGDSNQLKATLAASGGKFTFQIAGTEPENGTYAIVDANTLTWMSGDASYTFKRVSSNPQEMPLGIPKQSDPGVVGVWQGKLVDSARVTVSISASGRFIETAESANDAKQLIGTIEVANGKFRVKAPNDVFRAGTYRLVDPHALTWTYEGLDPVTLKRIAANP